VRAGKTANLEDTFLTLVAEQQAAA
jgi:hypothetical protein